MKSKFGRILYLLRRRVRRMRGRGAAREGEGAHRRGRFLTGRRAEMPAVRGTLRISRFSADGAERGARHRTRFVNGPSYTGMEDNDLRGFLDGTFLYGWNQPGQHHVRAGRQSTVWGFGEYELFRFIQRWADIRLPERATVLGASLTLQVAHDSPDIPLVVMLYAVHRDWNPGDGGIQRNNMSPPAPGEVWWNDGGFGEWAWGLPGAGYPSEDPAEGDTSLMPLAEARYEPGDSTVEFSDEGLVSYVNSRVAEGLPLLFLVKLQDHQEDTTGTIIHFWSGNEGDSRLQGRRPVLTLDWEAPETYGGRGIPVFLEHGRKMELPRVEMEGGPWHAVSCTPEPGYASPTLEVRGGGGATAGSSDWRVVTGPFEADWRWMDVRVRAVHDPVAFGDPFRASLRDTWIRTAAPEQQEVPWTFVSPTGVRHRATAEYGGDWIWHVSFMPDEVGPWRVRWSQTFGEEHYESVEATFDVVLRDRENAVAALEAFRAKAVAAAPASRKRRPSRLMEELARLERQVLQLEAPGTFRGSAGAEVRSLLREIRGIFGERVPDPIPLVSADPPPWAADSRQHGVAPATPAAARPARQTTGED